MTYLNGMADPSSANELNHEWYAGQHVFMDRGCPTLLPCSRPRQDTADNPDHQTGSHRARVCQHDSRRRAIGEHEGRDRTRGALGTRDATHKMPEPIWFPTTKETPRDWEKRQVNGVLSRLEGPTDHLRAQSSSLRRPLALLFPR